MLRREAHDQRRSTEVEERLRQEDYDLRLVERAQFLHAFMLRERADRAAAINERLPSPNHHNPSPTVYHSIVPDPGHPETPRLASLAGIEHLRTEEEISYVTERRIRSARGHLSQRSSQPASQSIPSLPTTAAQNVTAMPPQLPTTLNPTQSSYAQVADNNVLQGNWFEENLGHHREGIWW